MTTHPTAAQQAVKLVEELAERHQRCLNSVVEASLAFPNVGSYIEQLEKERDALRALVSELCGALEKVVILNHSWEKGIVKTSPFFIQAKEACRAALGKAAAHSGARNLT